MYRRCLQLILGSVRLHERIRRDSSRQQVETQSSNYIISVALQLPLKCCTIMLKNMDRMGFRSQGGCKYRLLSKGMDPLRGWHDYHSGIARACDSLSSLSSSAPFNTAQVLKYSKAQSSTILNSHFHFPRDYARTQNFSRWRWKHRIYQGKTWLL